jgi:hypothetical protein
VFNITAGGCAGDAAYTETYAHIKILNNWFHDSVVTDYVNPPPNGYHSECLQQDLGYITDLQIIGNVMQNCQDFGILLNGRVKGLRVENNFIDNPFQRIQGQESATLKSATPRGGSSIRLSGATSSDIVIRNNTVLGQLIVDSGNTNVVVTGNISNNASGTFAVQAVPSLFIDSNANNGGSYASRSDWNLHLASGSTAIDRGNPSSFPATDIDGQGRSGTPDAGADEAGDGLPPPTTTTTTTTPPPPPTTTEPPPTTTTPPPPTSYNMNAEYDRLESTSTHERWRKANPNEAVRVEAYWRSDGMKPSVSTSYGQFLINAAEEIRR